MISYSVQLPDFLIINRRSFPLTDDYYSVISDSRSSSVVGLYLPPSGSSAAVDIRGVRHRFLYEKIFIISFISI